MDSPENLMPCRPMSPLRPLPAFCCSDCRRDAQAAIDGVPIGLSDGVGIHSLAPGSHRVVLRIAGKEVAHTVNVRSHRIFTVTATGIVATEP